MAIHLNNLETFGLCFLGIQGKIYKYLTYLGLLKAVEP